VAGASRRLLAWVAVLAMAGCATHGARNYADDGPPDRVPANLAAVPDAVPRVEALVASANRPYSAMGKSFAPDIGDAPFTQRGVASWYGKQFHGNRTSSGEPYDMFAMTAAHPTLPIPSYARVTTVRDGRSVVVRINDRGPFLRDRIIDLSYAAATRLGLVGTGSGEVVVQKITRREIEGGSAPAPGASAGAALAALHAPALAIAGAAPVASFGGSPAGKEPAQTAPVAGHGPYFSVQLGAFSRRDNADATRDRLALMLSTP
jgi:rare lipoprotein A